MVDSTHQSNHCDEEKEDSYSNDSSNDVDVGHQTQALAPSSHSNEQQAHQHIDHVESAQRILGAGKATTNHLPSSGDPSDPKDLGEGTGDRLLRPPQLLSL